jgi:hypothetical protein
MRMKKFCGAMIAAALVVGAWDAWATTARRLSNRELAENAEVIVVGRAGESRPSWEGRTLVTLVTVTVTETLKGTAAGTITIALPGGVDMTRRIPIGMTFAGAPTLKPGEDVFLFLGHDDAVADAYVVMGFSQGKFSIVREPNGRQVVSRDLTQILLQGGTGVVPGAISYTSLAEFRDEITAYLR